MWLRKFFIFIFSDNDDLLNFDIGDGDFADGQLNEDELLLSDEGWFARKFDSKFRGIYLVLHIFSDELLETKHEIPEKSSSPDTPPSEPQQNVDQGDPKPQPVSQKPPETRKRLKRRNPNIISPEKVTSKAQEVPKKPDEDNFPVKKLKIPEKTEEFIKTQVKKTVESNKILEIQKSPETKMCLDPKNILEVRKILDLDKKVEKVEKIEKVEKVEKLEKIEAVEKIPDPVTIPDPEPEKLVPETPKIQEPEPTPQIPVSEPPIPEPIQKPDSTQSENTKLLNERLENLENAPDDVLELEAGPTDVPPGTEVRLEPDENDNGKRNNKFMKNYYRQGKMGLGYQPNFGNQMRPDHPHWVGGPNFPPGPQSGPPNFPGGPPMIRPNMHLLQGPGRLPGPPQRHPMGPRMPMQGPPMMGMGPNFPPGPRGPGPFFNNFMGRPNGPRQRFFYPGPNPNHNPNQMRPQNPNPMPLAPQNPASKSPVVSPIKQNPGEPGPEYIPSPIGQPQGPPFMDSGPGPVGRKVLINPNFKGGVEAAKSE